MDDDEDRSEQDRAAQVRGALLKALAVVVVIGVVVALGTTLVVHALGLNDSESAGPVGGRRAEPTKPLPTKALEVPGEKQDSASPEPSASPSADSAKKKNGKLKLDISPVKAKPMERVNLTGTYKGADNLALQVQRFEDGSWTGFGVEANVRVGTYATYVQTGRVGEQRFRMYDPQARVGSNVVMVTIG